MEERIQALMQNLQISRDEALQVLEDDKRIDRGEHLFELTAEQKVVEKKMRQAPRTVNAKPPKRERKTDNDKHHLMQILEIAIGHNPNVNNFQMVNDERECTFTFNGKKYKIVLSAPRS